VVCAFLLCETLSLTDPRKERDMSNWQQVEVREDVPEPENEPSELNPPPAPDDGPQEDAPNDEPA
jgi:hypothetical protein